jgi:hypothetical protein
MCKAAWRNAKGKPFACRNAFSLRLCFAGACKAGWGFAGGHNFVGMDK